MTRSGWVRCQWRCSGSSPAACTPTGWACCSPSGRGGGRRGGGGGGPSWGVGGGGRGRWEEVYLSRVRALPADTRELLLVAAADQDGDPELVYKAAAQLGAAPEAGEAAGTSRLVSWQPRVRFRHPMIRSAAYYAAPPESRRRAHAALAAVTDPPPDPDRRASPPTPTPARPGLAHPAPTSYPHPTPP